MSKLATVINETEVRFSEIAPTGIIFAAEKGFAIQLLSGNDRLKKAASESPESLQQALTNVAAIGLSLNPAEKLAYLLPRNVKIKTQQGDQWVSKVCLEPSYMGLIRLATDSGSIKWCQAYGVYQNDTFVDNGPGNKPQHKTAGDNAFTSDRGQLVGVCCEAKTADGDYLTTMMDMAAINDIKGRSESGKKGYGPWMTDFLEMAKKTVIRNAFKTWPRTNERAMSVMAAAVELSNVNEGFEAIVTEPDVGQFSAEQKEYFDQLIGDGSALAMYVMGKTTDYATWVNLNHSFEKGKKGKYRAMVDGLVKDGQAMAMQIADSISEAAAGEDDLGCREIVGELTIDEMTAINEMLDDETKEFIRKIS